MGAIAIYVLDLLAEILGEQPEREKTYPWAVGDVGSKTGRAARLPFDAVWESRKLIVEINEDQHRRPVAFWDKPTAMTVSGVSRGEQRGIYAQREIPWERHPRPSERDRGKDMIALRRLCRTAGIDC